MTIHNFVDFRVSANANTFVSVKPNLLQTPDALRMRKSFRSRCSAQATWACHCLVRLLCKNNSINLSMFELPSVSIVGLRSCDFNWWLDIRDSELWSARESSYNVSRRFVACGISPNGSRLNPRLNASNLLRNASNCNLGRTHSMEELP